MLNVGFDSYVSKEKILVITNADSAPLKRKYQDAQDSGKFIDCTKGRRTVSLIHLIDGFIVSSSVNPETLIKRINIEKIKERDK